MNGQLVQISDRDRRKKVVCGSCGEFAAHRGHGYCVTCYGRWDYWGRPEEGPPKPGETARKAAELPVTCKNEHLWADNLRFNNKGKRYCLACKRAQGVMSARRRLEARHEGHTVVALPDGRAYCETCIRDGHDIDEIAVVRAIQGDPPASLLLAEREAAIVRLRGYGLFYRVIAERVGCSLQTAHAVCARLGVTDPANARACWDAMSADLAVAA